MKKRVVAFVLLGVMMTAALSGCAKKQEPVKEPDTDSRTRSHMIGKYQKAVYSFHMKKTDENEKSKLNVFMLSDDEEDPLEADNRCIIDVGGDRYIAFKAHHASGLDYNDRWITGTNPSEWKMEEPYASMNEVSEADITVTLIRNGKSIRVIEEIDGEKAWQADGSIKHLRNKEVYIYLSWENYTLTDIQYQDMGFCFVVPQIVYIILVILGIIAIFVIHTIAKMGEVKLYYVDAPVFCALMSSAFTIGILGVGLMIFGRTHPDALNQMFFNYINVPLPSGGAWFWVPTAIFGAIAIIMAIVVITQAVGVFNNALRLLCAFGLGILHTMWYYTLANIIIQSIDEIFGIIFLIIIAVVINAVADNTVVKSYSVYSKRGFEGTVYTLEPKDDGTRK